MAGVAAVLLDELLSAIGVASRGRGGFGVFAGREQQKDDQNSFHDR